MAGPGRAVPDGTRSLTWRRKDMGWRRALLLWAKEATPRRRAMSERGYYAGVLVEGPAGRKDCCVLSSVVVSREDLLTYYHTIQRVRLGVVMLSSHPPHPESRSRFFDSLFPPSSP